MTSPTYKVEIAFDSGWATAAGSRTWTDVSDYVLWSDGININVGRRDERSVADANQLSLTLKNTDGRFTPGKTGGAYYPNVKIGRPIRVTAQTPPKKDANLLSAANADFESGVGSWTAGGTVPPTLAQSATQAYSGSNSLRVTWGTGGTFPLAQVSLTGLTVSSIYTFAVYVYVPTGSPDVRTAIGGIAAGTSTAVKDSWVRLTQTFTATGTSHNLQIWPSTSPTAGQLVYVDAAMAVEGSTVGDFNTTTIVTSTRFLGFVDEWNVAWPATTDTHSTCAVTATSRLSRLGAQATLRPLLQEVILTDAPSLYWPLGEAMGATRAASIGSVSTVQRVKDGTVVFGNGNGPLTDESTAVKITGSGLLKSDGTFTTGSAFTVEGLVCAITGDPSATVLTMFITGTDPSTVTVTFDWVTGAPVLCAATLTGSAGAPNLAQDYAPGFSDNEVHHWAVTVSGTLVKIYWDGVSVASSSAGSSYGAGASQINLGTSGSDYALSHVAVHTSALSAATLLEHTDAALTGYISDTAADRLARYAEFAGIPAGETSFETGQVLDITHIDTTDTTALDLMRKVETTENGVLFDAADGTLTFHDRAHRYAAAAAASWAAGTSGQIQADFSPTLDQSVLVNDATGTSGDGSVVERVVDQASFDDYGPAQASVEVFTSDEDEPLLAASWLVGNYAEPAVRAPAVSVEIANMTATDQAVALGVTVGDKLALSSLPSQAPASAIDYFSEGYAESITSASHRLTFNVTPGEIYSAWILEDATYGVLDTTTRLAY